MGGHDLAHGHIEEPLLQAFRGPAYVAVRYQARHFAVYDSYGQTQLSDADFDDGLSQPHLGVDDGQVVGSHHIVGPHEQPASQGASGVESGKVALLEMAGFHEGASQGVAHGQRGCGAAGGGQIERAGFLRHEYVYMVGGILGQERFRVSRHAHKRYATLYQ